MRNRIAIAFVVAACTSSGPSPAVCERARAQALANQRHYLAEVMADARDAAKPALLLQAKREVASLEAKFVATCRAMPNFKPECFASPEAERSRGCRELLKPFWCKTLR